MANGAKVAMAVGAGYLLGRTGKMRLAFMLAAAGITGKFPARTTDLVAQGLTFHELAPTLTRVIVVLEYHPQGLFERTGNICRAQGRRVRLELKHFQRQVMSHAMLHPDEVEGWHGEIREGEVVSAGHAQQTNGAKATSHQKPRRTPTNRSRTAGRSSSTAQRTSTKQRSRA